MFRPALQGPAASHSASLSVFQDPRVLTARRQTAEMVGGRGRQEV